AGAHHAETFARKPLEVLGVVELLDPLVQQRILLLEQLGLMLQSRQLIALGQVRAKGNRRREQQRQHHDDQQDCARRRAGTPARPDCGAGAQAGCRDGRHSSSAGAGSSNDASSESSLPEKAIRPYGWRPAYRAVCPSSSSMRSSWLYLAVRSPRDGAPALIC